MFENEKRKSANLNCSLIQKHDADEFLADSVE